MVAPGFVDPGARWVAPGLSGTEFLDRPPTLSTAYILKKGLLSAGCCSKALLGWNWLVR